MQDGCGDQQPGRHHRRRGDVLDRDLDEQVRRAPDRRQQEEQRDVTAACGHATPRAGWWRTGATGWAGTMAPCAPPSDSPSTARSASPTRSSTVSSLCWSASRTTSSSPSSLCSGRSTAATSTRRRCSAVCRARARACCRARARTPACSTSVRAWRSRSRSRATTTPRRSSPSRAPPPASAGSCATSSAMGARPVALLDGLRFGANDWHFSRAVGGIGQYGNSVGVADGRRGSRLRRGVRRQLPGQRDVRRPAPGRARHAGQGDRARARSSSSTARRPAATGSAAHPCSRARSSARSRPRSAPPCRSATRSPARS